MTTTPADAQNRFGAGNSRGAARGPAKGAATEESGDGKAAGKKKSLFKSKKFLIALVGVLAIGGGAYKFLMPSTVGPPTGGDVVPMDAMTLNLADGHYLKIAISVQLVKGQASATSFSTSKAAELTIYEFSDRSVDSLTSNAAKKRLTADLLTKLKAAYPGEVFDVNLTQFVTQ